MSAAPATQLFAPRPTYRFTRTARAYLNFSLKEASKGPVLIEIFDAKGAPVRQLRNVPTKVGLNRATWDMRYEAPRLVALRTASPENPHIWEEPRFRGSDSRPVTHWGLQQAEVGPIAAPGKYTVKLTVDGQSFTQSLEIVKDPNTASTDADLEATFRLQLQIRDDINATSAIVNQLEWRGNQPEEAQNLPRSRVS